MELFIVFFLGLFVGAWLKDYYWMENAFAAKRLRRRGRFYKVIRLGDEDSWQVASQYRQDSKHYDLNVLKFKYCQSSPSSLGVKLAEKITKRY